MHVCMDAYTFVWMHSCEFECVNVCVYAVVMGQCGYVILLLFRELPCVCVCASACACVHACMHACVRMQVCGESAQVKLGT